MLVWIIFACVCFFLFLLFYILFQKKKIYKKEEEKNTDASINDHLGDTTGIKSIFQLQLNKVKQYEFYVSNLAKTFLEKTKALFPVINSMPPEELCQTLKDIISMYEKYKLLKHTFQELIIPALLKIAAVRDLKQDELQRVKTLNHILSSHQLRMYDTISYIIKLVNFKNYQTAHFNIFKSNYENLQIVADNFSLIEILSMFNASEILSEIDAFDQQHTPEFFQRGSSGKMSIIERELYEKRLKLEEHKIIALDSIDYLNILIKNTEPLLENLLKANDSLTNALLTKQQITDTIYCTNFQQFKKQSIHFLPISLGRI